MKTKFLLFFLLIFSVSFGQMRDLATLSGGKMVYSAILYDPDNNVYGYLYLYERDANKKDKTMEYVFLDKNLNEVSNTTYTDKVFSGVICKYYDCTLMGDYIILNKYYYYYKSIYWTNNIEPQPLLTTIQIISLKDNSVSSEYKYENEQFSELTTDFDKMKKEYKGQATKNIIYGFSSGSSNGFFIFDDSKGKDYLSKALRFYNEKMEPVWTYMYNPDGTKNDYKIFRFLYTKNTTIYLMELRIEKNLSSECKIVALDFQTGKEKYEYMLETPQNKYSHTVRAKEVNGQLIISGNYSPYNQSTDFSLDNNLGFYKIVLDEQGNEIQKTYTQWTDFSKYIDVDEKGKVEKDFRLRPIRTFFFNDGTLSILTEKGKMSTGLFTYGEAKTADYVLFTMNKDFTVNDVQIIKKDVTVGVANFLFSQYIKDESGAVFFFQNYAKNEETNEKQWVLGINTIIEGKLTLEKIPVSSKKKYFIQPAPAKEGYIMLREYNEKDKYNQIRLERLNY